MINKYFISCFQRYRGPIQQSKEQEMHYTNLINIFFSFPITDLTVISMLLFHASVK